MSNTLLEGVVVNISSSNEQYNYSLELLLLTTTTSNSVLLIRAADVNNDSF
jgi:hypothetical protein